MTRGEIIELALIPAFSGSVFWQGARLPTSPGWGRLVLTLAGLLLLQSLIRDLWLLWAARARQRSQPGPAMQCLCVESGVGMLGIVTGAVLVLIGLPMDFTLSPMAWTLAVGLTLLSGFVVKDLVVQWNPLGIRRDPDHINIVVKFRS